MKYSQEKQDLSIAEELPLHLHTNTQNSKINLFIADSFKNLQIIQQIYHQSYEANEKGLTNQSTQRAGLNRKTSQRSDSYHRVTNSRKIKTKRTAKQNLPRSEYFYFHQINQYREQGPIQKLLNDYEAFHQMILNNDFSPIEKSVIRLSHYGNKRKASKSREFSIEKRNIGHNHHHSFCTSKINDHSQQSKKLSRSTIVPDVELKKSVVIGANQQKLNHQTTNHTQIRKNPIPTRQALSKYTTPIRTIYLNKSQQSPQYLNSSSINKLSVSTPLRNNKPYLTENEEKTFSSILGKEPSENKRKFSNYVNDHKMKLSVVSSQKKWKINEQVENAEILPFNKAKNNQIYLSKYHSDFLESAQSRNPYPSSDIFQPFQTTVSVLHSNHQSHSRSGSRKGLSLTQSASKIVTKSKSQLICPKSIERLSYNNVERQADILARKLDQKGRLQSKRVEIRIY